MDTDLSILLIFWREMRDGGSREFHLLLDTSQSEQEDGAESKVGVHVCTWHANLEACR